MANSDKATGYEYVYYDSTIDKLPLAQRFVTKSPYLVNRDKGALNLTLDSVFNDPDASTGWILYNDEKPADVAGKDDSNLGHTKRVVAFYAKTKTGYWLLHSWPKFAEPKVKADATPKYGRTYLCIFLDLDTLASIAGQMINYQGPQTYL
jgi:deoxyribonuclease II